MALSEGNRKEKRTTAPPPVIPDKLYFRIGEVARLLDLPAYVLRFWETEFPQLKPNKGGTGQRLYRRRDVELVLRIRSLLYDEGYTIPGARQLLKAQVRGRDPQAPHPEPLTSRTSVSPDAAEASSEDTTPPSIRLRRMRSELREIASLLAQPAAAATPGRIPNPSHKGLHMAARRRPAHLAITPLFPIEETPTDE